MRVLLAFLLTVFAPPLQAQDGPVVLVGQVVDPVGAPVVGAELVVTASGAGAGGWTDVRGRSDRRGRFRLRFLPPGGFVRLHLTSPGLASHQETWHDLEAGQTIDLQVITLQTAGVVVGRIVDPRGEQIRGAWTVSASTSSRGVLGRGTQLDPETGEFRIEGLPAVRVELVGHLLGVRTGEATVEVQPGVEHFVELRYDGPDLSRRISVRLHPAAVPFLLEPEHVHLRDEAGERLDANQAEVFFEFVFDDLEPGSYGLVVDDPRFERWTQDGLRPGDSVTPKLVGAATLTLEVVDAETGAPLPRFGLEVFYQDSLTSTSGSELLAPGSAAPPGGLLAGVVAVPCELVLQAPGRPAVRVELDRLEAGATTPVRIEVPRASRLVGRVVDGEGRPGRGVQIEWTPGSEHGHTGGGTMSVNGRTIPNVQKVLDVDDQGRFELTEAGPGMHALRARWSPWLVEDLTIELPVGTAEELVIEQPAHGWLEGTLRVPLGIDPSGVRLDVRQGGPRSFRSILLPGRGGAAQGFEIQGDHYRLGPLPPRHFEIIATPASSSGRMSSVSRTADALAEVTIRAGETHRQDLDLRAIFPGDLDVHVSAGGAPLADVLVRVLAGGRSGSTRSQDLDPNNDAQFRGLIAGRYSVLLESEAGGWSYDHPSAVAVGPGQGAAAVVEVPLVSRTVRFEDDAGAPLALTTVSWACGRGQARSVTDVAGHLNLTLVEGAVAFGRGGPVTVEGTWSAGEAVLVVVLPGGE